MKYEDLRFPFLVVVATGIFFIFLLPYIPVDETRYLAVAWEMNLNDSYIVPIFNGLPYAHKPPLLFWLINLDWFIFGINESTLRLIPIAFSLLNLILLYRIAMQLWNNRIIARYAVLILSSTSLYLIWSALIMFDVILTFWTLLGITGFLSAAKSKNICIRSWALVSMSVAGGILTKGPVILVHIIPVSLLYFLWRQDDNCQPGIWYAGILLSILVGLALVALWVVPAVLTGGETYKQAILWGQTANRVTSSFAHQQPIWWYIPMLPVLLFPWLFIKPAWTGYALYKHDSSYRFVVIWMSLSIILFSLISGKNIHYLLPVLPAFCLFLAKNIATQNTDSSGIKRLSIPVAIIYIVAGFIILIISITGFSNDLANSQQDNIQLFSVGIIVLGSSIILIKPSNIENNIKLINISSAILILMLLLMTGNLLSSRYDMHDSAQFIKNKQEAGYEIIHYGKYFGQFHFLGHLSKPVVVFKEKERLANYLKDHKKSILISYEERNKTFDNSEMLYEHAYRGKKLVVWNKKGVESFLHR